MSIFRGLSERYMVRHPDALPTLINAIACVTMGSFEDHLPKAALALLNATAALRAQYPEARLIVTAHSGCAPAAENALRKEKFPDALFAGAVGNTPQEMAAIIKAMRERQSCDGDDPVLVVVTDEWHSRSAHLALQHEAKKAGLRVKIYMHVVLAERLIGPDNVIRALRSRWTWALANIARHLIMVVPGGYEWLKRSKLKQPMGR